MKKHLKRPVAAAAALALILSLAACGGGITADSATDLIQGNLDVLYLGKFDPDYLELVDITENEAEETYLDGLSVEAEYFTNYFGIEYVTDELEADIIDLYKDIYAQSKYTVNPATKIDESTFGVKVVVEPLDIFSLVDEDWDEGMAAYYDQYGDVDLSTLSEEAYQACDALWAECILALCREKLPEMGYMEEKSLVIQVTQDDDGYWSMLGDDFTKLDEIIIYYP